MDVILDSISNNRTHYPVDVNKQIQIRSKSADSQYSNCNTRADQYREHYYK